MKEFISKINLKQYFQFITVGGIGVIINISLLYLITEFIGIHYMLSEAIAFLIATIHNYLLNKTWTFKEKLQEDPFKKFIQYLLVSIVGLMVNLTVLFTLVEFFELWYIFAELFATAVSSAVNYTGNKFWTFKNNPTSENLNDG
jgi:putative flippase GtrA